MKTISFLLIALISLTSCNDSTQKQETDLNDSLNVLDERYQALQDSFVIAFPTEPTRSVNSIPVQGEQEIEMVDYTCVKSSYVYMVSISPQTSEKITTNEDIISLLSDTRDSFCSDLEINITEEKEVRLGEYRGIFFKANSAKYYAAVSNFLINGFLYQITILGNGKEISQENIESFINSFELTKKESDKKIKK